MFGAVSWYITVVHHFMLARLQVFCAHVGRGELLATVTNSDEGSTLEHRLYMHARRRRAPRRTFRTRATQLPRPVASGDVAPRYLMYWLHLIQTNVQVAGATQCIFFWTGLFSLCGARHDSDPGAWIISIFLSDFLRGVRQRQVRAAVGSDLSLARPAMPSHLRLRSALRE